MRASLKTSANSAARRGVLGVCLALPFVMGGCPEFRDDLAGVFEAATRTALLGTDDEWTIAHAVRGSLVDATIDLVFDQFRSDNR